MKLKFFLPLFLGILFVSSFVFAKDIQVVTDEGIFVLDSETGEVKSKITSEGYDSDADGIYTGEGDDVYLNIDTNTTLVSKGAGGFLVGSSDSGASRLHVSP
ncbi:hypothetical protein K9L04_01440, partial [Patescibacteria group bacterium]|nr:hypothetical protein [Patescibacteria group bacterium]